MRQASRARGGSSNGVMRRIRGDAARVRQWRTDEKQRKRPLIGAGKQFGEGLWGMRCVRVRKRSPFFSQIDSHSTLRNLASNSINAFGKVHIQGGVETRRWINKYLLRLEILEPR
ncbi:hypothetical protein TcasGA2_TC000307 [Tribolium castaneum]|uniref:Uncharacterized protein n=1 Tax=Tribolium castaneum TaxID=7070 RepID=D6WB90_TRICA|nr:hypothetical protein TcasGA2_TC000307 [Tribolium castaneum]